MKRSEIIDTLTATVARLKAAAPKLSQVRQAVKKALSVPHPNPPKKWDARLLAEKNKPTKGSLSQDKYEDGVTFFVTVHDLPDHRKAALIKELDRLGLEVVDLDYIGSQYDWKTKLHIEEKGATNVSIDAKQWKKS